MRTGKDRVQVDGMNIPISLGDVHVKPGDILLGSDDGVVVVPREKEEEVLKIAQSISQAEASLLAEALKGTRLDEARKKFGYHQLQRRAN
jgi:regulator of RNase E activity RraA